MRKEQKMSLRERLILIDALRMLVAKTPKWWRASREEYERCVWMNFADVLGPLPDKFVGKHGWRIEVSDV